MTKLRAMLGCFALCLATFALLVSAVDRSKFRTCHDTRFCREYRQRTAPQVENQWFRINKATLQESKGKVFADILSSDHGTHLNFELSFLQSGNLRFRVSEKSPRWQPLDLLIPAGLAIGEFKKIEDSANLPGPWKNARDTFAAYQFQDPQGKENTVVLQFSPLKLEVYQEKDLVVVLNDRNLIHFEQRSTGASSGGNEIKLADEGASLDRHKGKTVVDYGEDGLALYADGTREEKTEAPIPVAAAHGSTVETFNGHTDSVPNGPTSVGIDISFPAASHIYGIPEHTTSLSLPTTSTGSAGASPHYQQPYRLYNLDVFEYELQETMALYGNIPFLWGHGKAATSNRFVSAGIFFFNPSESFVDISDGKSSSSFFSTANTYKESHWVLESGDIDIFIMTGPTPRDLVHQFATLVGTQQLPPMFSLGYHQCRWNYRDERDVAQVNAQFEALDYPYDVIWLDIEHTNGKRYFTWDSQLFPNPLEMQKNISHFGRKMVTIIDPHIKRDDNFHIHKEATAKGLYIKDKNGNDFDGWCWPGSSSYLDFTAPHVRQWWAEQFSLSTYQGSSLDLYTWNDMNEPSVFNGPEVSMSKDAKNLAGVEHREWHNLYGIYMAMATAQGQIQRCHSFVLDAASAKLRPFVLTRAFWAGSQRFGAMWTGDNKAEWSHLKATSAEVLSLNIAGFSFSGSDTGGFFGDSSAELWTRWYQAGAFMPFFRGHAHHDTKRKEPWVYGEPHTSIHRKVAMIRYSLLPHWYTAFFEAYETGMPVMRPLFFEFPEHPELFAIDDEWLVGSSLLVKPVVDAGAKSVAVVFPKVEDACNHGTPLPWYEFESLKAMPTHSTHINYPVELSTIPAFIRPGSIVSRKLRLRRSSKLMFYDPYTLTITPGSCGRAEGLLYLDDESTFAHEESGMFAVRKFIFTGTELQSVTAKPAFYSINKGQNLVGAPTFNIENYVERIVITGQTKAPKKVFVKGGDGGALLSFMYDPKSQLLTVKKPSTRVMDNWVILFEF